MISKYGEVEVVVVFADNPRQTGSHGYNNWKDFYPIAGECFNIQNILDARATARSEGKLAVNAKGKVDGSKGMNHILWDLMEGFTKLKDPADIELFKNNPDTYNGIKKHQGTQKRDSSIVPDRPSVSNPRFKYHDFPLNQILYGPPGTGKTYETKSRAVEIITGETLSRRDQLNSRYNSLVEDGRIQFVTFHQSYGYEDFVEGIKPKLDKPGRDVQYKIKDGIFKQLCKEAEDKKNLTMDSTIIMPSANLDVQEKITFNPNEYKGRNVWQLRIDTHGFLNETSIAVDGFDWFNNNNLEYEVKNCKGDKNRFIKILDEQILEQESKGIDPNDMLRNYYSRDNIELFCLEVKVGDLFIIHERPYNIKSYTKEANRILAVVEVIGDYKYDKDKGGYNHTRKIKYLWRKGGNKLPIDIRNINNKMILSEQTVLLAKKIKPEALIKKVNEYIGGAQEENPSISNADHPHIKNRFVLIIDEINRGNISKILGELITLLEEDKRLGEDEALKVTLPYSNKKFGIPNNLYIIGTMNTADRSIAFLDTALRRRFNFKEMMPKTEKLKKNMEGINLQVLLEAINANIIKELDRDHQIGHSYLLNIESMSELSNTFRHKICPLLDEYFYDRRDKIKEVLNSCKLIDDPKGDGDWKWAIKGEFKKSVNYTDIYKDK